jgi:hypothetical protein
MPLFIEPTFVTTFDSFQTDTFLMKKKLPFFTTFVPFFNFPTFNLLTMNNSTTPRRWALAAMALLSLLVSQNLFSQCEEFTSVPASNPTSIPLLLNAGGTRDLDDFQLDVRGFGKNASCQYFFTQDPINGPWVAAPITFDCTDFGPAQTWYVRVGGNPLLGDDGGPGATIRTLTITVSDNIPPTISINPIDELRPADVGACTYTATGTEFDATTFDNTDPTCPSTITYVLSGATSGTHVGTLDAVDFNVGITTVNFSVVDAAGNVTNGTAYDVEVEDTEAPNISVCPANEVALTAPGLCSSATLTIPAPVFPGDIDENCSIVDIDWAATGATAATGSGDVVLAFSLGITTVTYTVADGSGNTGTCDFTVTVTDDEDPNFTGVPGNQSIGTSTGSATPLNLCDGFWAWTHPSVTDNCVGPYAMTVAYSGATMVAAAPAIQGAAVNQFFNLGLTTVTYLATDANGNTRSATFTVTVTDNVAPVVTPAPTNQTFTFSTTAGDCSKVVTFSRPSLGSVSDCGTVTLSETVQPGSPDPSVLSGAPAFPPMGGGSITVQFPAGTTVIRYAWTDNAMPANVTFVDYTFIINEDENPTAACKLPGTVVLTLGANGKALLTPAMIDNGSNDNCGSVLLAISSPDDNPSVTGEFDCADLANPAIPVTLIVSDLAIPANTATCNTTIDVVDNLPPSILCPGSITLPTGPSSCTASFNGGLTFVAPGSTLTTVGEYTDNCGTPTINYNLSGVTTGSGAYAAIGSVGFNKGTTNVTYTLSDGNGNNTVCNFSVTVQDLTPPNNTGGQAANSTVTANATLSSCLRQVSWPVPTFADNCPGVVTVTSSHAPGAFFPFGMTTVTYTATDAAGNVRLHTFKVNVVDNVLPIAKCQDVTAVLDGSGNVVVLPTTIDNGSSDNCFYDYYEYGTGNLLTQYSFDCSDLGPNQVVLDIRDGQGNADTCRAVVTIVDDENPVATCVANQTFDLDGTGEYFLSAVDLDGGSTDNCAIVDMQLQIGAGPFENDHTFDCDQTGTFVVTLRVTDAAGNTDDCTLNVTVRDVEPPVADAPANILVGCAAFDQDNPATTGGSATATDNCEVVSVTYNPDDDFVIPGSCPNEFTVVRTWVATDASGNTDIDLQVIVVEDITAPVWNAPNTIEGVTDSPNFCDGLITVNLSTTGANPVISDACGDVSVTFTVNYPAPIVDDLTPDPLPLDVNLDVLFPIGTSFVYLVAEDACGNISRDTVAVIIRDTQGPTFTFDPPFDTICGANYVFPNTPGSCSNIFTWQRPINALFNVFDCAPFTVKEEILNANGSTMNSVQQTISLTNPYSYTPTFFFQAFPTAQFPVGVTTVRYTATDNSPNSNTSVCEFTVEIVDTQAPVLNCPQPQTLAATCDSAQVPDYTSLVQVLDNCSGNVDLVQSPAAGTFLIDFFGPSPQTGDQDTIFISGTDGYNSTTCFFLLTLQDGDDPIPAVATLPPVVDSCGMFIIEAPFAFDPCNPEADTIYGTPSAPVGQFLNTNPPSYNLMPGNYVITWVYNDGNGNISTQPQNITVLVDNFKPTAICSADSANLSTTGTATVFPPLFDNGSFDPQDCGPLSYKLRVGTTLVDSLNFTCANIGSNTITLVVVDAKGNVSDPCFTTLKVKDTTLPVLVGLPANITVNCGTSIPTAPTLTATDACGTPTVTFVQTSNRDTVGCGQFDYTITRTWTARDAANNTATGVQTIKVQDITAPIFLPTTPDTLVVPTAPNNTDCTARVNLNIVPFISDCSSGNNLTLNNLEGFFSQTDTTETLDLGSYVTNFFATDACGNQASQSVVIVVRDGTNPVAACINGVSVSLQSSGTVLVTAQQINASSTDNCTATNNLDLKIQRLDPLGAKTNSILFNCSDATGVQHPVRLFVKDEAGNESNCQTYIVVQDNVAPTITCPPNKTIQCSDPTTIAANGTPTAMDNCLGNVEFNSKDTIVAGVDPICTVLRRTWTARDGSGNTATCLQLLSIQDTIAPTLSATPGDDTLACYTLLPLPSLVTASDICDPNVPVLFTQDTIDVAVGPCGQYNYTVVRTRTATDDCGNSVTHVRKFVIIDDQAPQFLGMPDVVQVFTANYPPNANCNVTIGTAEFDLRQYLTDCEDDTSITVTNNAPQGDGALSIAGTYAVGQYKIQFTAVDACGNVGVDSILLRVVDNSAPTVVCNDDIIVALGTDGVGFLTVNDVALSGTTDNCAIDTMYLSQTEFDCSELGTNPVTLTVIDVNGNANSCTIDVEVEINDNSGFSLVVTSTPESYFGSDDGTASAAASGGSGDFSYTWSTGANTQNLANLPAGSYTVTVVDTDNGCLLVDTAVVDPGAKVQLNIAAATGCQGDVVNVPVTVENFFEIYSFAFTLNAGNGSVATILGATNINPALTGFIGNLAPTNNFGAVWANTGAPLVLADGSKLFDLRVQLNAAAPLSASAAITVVNAPVATEFNQDSAGLPVVVPIETVNGSITVTCSADAVEIGGDIRTWRAPVKPVPGVTVNLTGGTTATQTTGIPGTYLFSGIPNNTNTVTACSKSTPGSAGLSSADLLFIVNHIFGTTLLSPYQWVAADVNADGNISLNDYLRIQRVVLATDMNILGSPDWKFVPASYVFPSPNPLSVPFPQTIAHTPATTDYLDDDFVAVRMGDVNGNITPTLAGDDVEERFGGAVQRFRVEDRPVQAGELVTVPFRASDFRNRLAYQMTINFDPNVLALEDMQAGVLPLTADNFGTAHLADGQLTTLWVAREAKTLADDEVLFTLTFRALRSHAGLSGLLRLSSDKTAAKAIDGNGELMKVDLEFLRLTDGQEENSFALYQNQPNPFAGTTTVGFRLPQASRGTLRVFNAAGQLLRTVVGNYEKGYNEVRFRASELGQPGVYYYELETPTHTDRKKMILVN